MSKIRTHWSTKADFTNAHWLGIGRHFFLIRRISGTRQSEYVLLRTETYYGMINREKCFTALARRRWHIISGDHRKVYKPDWQTSLPNDSSTISSPLDNCYNPSPHLNMYLIKSIVVLAAAAAMVGATLTVERRDVCCLIA